MTKTDDTAAKAAEAATKSAEDQGAITTEADAEGAVKGYLGDDAADLVNKAKDGDDTVPAHTLVRSLATAATYAEPVPPGGHPSDPTSTTSVGAAAKDADVLAKADATRL